MSFKGQLAPNFNLRSCSFFAGQHISGVVHHQIPNQELEAVAGMRRRFFALHCFSLGRRRDPDRSRRLRRRDRCLHHHGRHRQRRSTLEVRDAVDHGLRLQLRLLQQRRKEVPQAEQSTFRRSQVSYPRPGRHHQPTVLPPVEPRLQVAGVDRTGRTFIWP